MPVIRSRYPDIQIPEDITFHELVFRNFDEYGNRKAIVDGVTGRSYTFNEVKTLMRNFGSALVKRGFSKGDVLLICLPNVPEYVIVYFGTLYLGGTVTAASPVCKVQELLYQLRDSGAKFLVTLPQFAYTAKSAAEKAGLKNVFVFGEAEKCESAWDLLKDDGRSFPVSVNINPREDICVLQYSSGTTGLQKGVMLSHYNMVSAFLMVDSMPRNRVFVTLGLLPFCYAYGMTAAMGRNMFWGNTVVVLPRFEADLFLRCIQEHKVDSFAIVPPTLLFLAKHPLVESYDLSSVRYINCSAAGLGKETSQALHRRLPYLVSITQDYGLSEALGCTFTPVNNVKAGSVGVLLPNMKCKIIDVTTGEILGENQDGEMCFKGPNVMKGYINKPKETEYTVDIEGWLHTGDIGHYDADGHFYIVGRIKELIKYNAFQVAPAEIEALLLTNPKIADAAVIGVPHPSAGELPKAFVVKRGEITEKEVADFVDARVAPYKKLRGGVEFIDQIPKNPSGKILRRVLREKAAQEQQNAKHKL